MKLALLRTKQLVLDTFFYETKNSFHHVFHPFLKMFFFLLMDLTGNNISFFKKTAHVFLKQEIDFVL